MAGEPAVEVAALTKTYGKDQVLREIDLVVEPGSVLALLGPNGSGKTTTIRILTTLAKPDSGTARVAGFDVRRDRRRVRRAISLTGQYAALDATQTGEENLRMIGKLAGLRATDARARSRELLERFDLTDAARRQVKTYSGGMRRRLDLAAGLLRPPSVMFLDEPTTGLDVRSRQALWQVVTYLAASGVTVFLTTQYLEEADRLADRVAVIDHGRVIEHDTPTALKHRVSEQRLDLTMTDRDSYESMLARLGSETLDANSETLTVGFPTDGSARHVRGLLDELDPDGSRVRTFAVHRASMDDVFLALTQTDGGARDGKPVRGEFDLEREASGV